MSKAKRLTSKVNFFDRIVKNRKNDYLHPSHEDNFMRHIEDITHQYIEKFGAYTTDEEVRMLSCAICKLFKARYAYDADVEYVNDCVVDEHINSLFI